MLSHLHILTLTHRGSSLKEIGQALSLIDGGEGGREAFLTVLKNRLELEELYCAATCNRILIFFSTRDRVDHAYITKMMQGLSTNLIEQIDHYQGGAAVNHLFEVSASIDSLVIGERQILGQLRDAYKQCQEWQLTGDDMRIVFQQMVLAAKAVYARTRIGEKSVSVVSLAMRKVLQRTPQPDSRVLLIGAGQTNVLVAKFLRKYNLQRVTVFNRNLERAQKLADTFVQGTALPLTELNSYDQGFDLMIVCTGSTDPLITTQNWEGLLAGEAADQKLVVDLAVPANVEAELVEASDFAYVDVEQLREEAHQNMKFRGQEISRAREVIDQYLQDLEQIYRQRLLERALKDFPVEVKAIRQRAVGEVFAKELEQVDPEARALIERMMGYMEKKYIGLPMRTAREELLG